MAMCRTAEREIRTCSAFRNVDVWIGLNGDSSEFDGRSGEVSQLFRKAADVQFDVDSDRQQFREQRAVCCVLLNPESTEYRQKVLASKR